MRKLTALIAATVTMSAVAYADEPSNKFVFEYNKTDMTSKVQREQTLNRMDNAIDAYCRTPGRRSISQVSAERKCVSKTRAAARKQMPRYFADDKKAGNRS